MDVGPQLNGFVIDRIFVRRVCFGSYLVRSYIREESFKVAMDSGVASLDLMLEHTFYNRPCLATGMLIHMCIYIWLLSKNCTASLTIAKLRSVKA